MSGERVAINTADFWPEDAEDVDEGVVVDWFAKEGKQIKEDETICVIQVEKVSIDIPAPVAGKIDEIALQEDDEFKRGDTLAWIQPE
ncbi:MAG: lipoyl domain-containing protein [Halobacteria archaeon]|nr:lipoyl domain-containing protein [Halobacteria archaeon]